MDPGRSKIRPGATPNGKKTINMSKKHPTDTQETAKSAKKTPKSEKCANMVPTWRSLDLDLGSFWPPLRKEKQYVKASIKFSGV